MAKATRVSPSNSSGVVFRGELQNYLGAAPTELVDLGVFPAVLGRFLDVCGLRDRLGDGRPSRDGRGFLTPLNSGT